MNEFSINKNMFVKQNVLMCLHVFFFFKVEIDNVTMYVFDLNLIRRTENIHSVGLHFYKRRTRWPITYALNEIYSSHRLSSLSAQIQLESETYGWQSFPIGDLIQRQLNYLSLNKKSEYFGLTFKPTVTTNTQRRNIIDLEKFSIYTPFMIIYSNDSKQTNVFEEFIPKNFEQESKAFEQFEKDINQTNRCVFRNKILTMKIFIFVFLDFVDRLKKICCQSNQIFYLQIGMIHHLPMNQKHVH